MKNTVVVVDEMAKKATKISRGLCIQIIRKQTGRTKKESIEILNKTNSNNFFNLNNNKMFAIKTRDYHRIYDGYAKLQIMGE